jgi:hypothetical protein
MTKLYSLASMALATLELAPSAPIHPWIWAHRPSYHSKLLVVDGVGRLGVHAVIFGDVHGSTFGLVNAVLLLGSCLNLYCPIVSS